MSTSPPDLMILHTPFHSVPILDLLQVPRVTIPPRKCLDGHHSATTVSKHLAPRHLGDGSYILNTTNIIEQYNIRRTTVALDGNIINFNENFNIIPWVHEPLNHQLASLDPQLTATVLLPCQQKVQRQFGFSKSHHYLLIPTHLNTNLSISRWGVFSEIVVNMPHVLKRPPRSRSAKT